MLPAWAPSLADVGDYVTSRTVDENTPGSDTPTGTFSATTYPTDQQVLRLISSAVQWVLNVTGPVAASLEASAASVAAMRAAALVELSYPVRNADVDAVTTPLLAEARFARDELVAANLAQGGVGFNSTGAPLGAFPEPVGWRGDMPRSNGWPW